MARYYKCEIMWNLLNRGWTESYYCDADQLLPNPPTTNPNNSASKIAVANLFRTTIVTQRAKLSGQPATILGIRVSGVNHLIPGETPNPGAIPQYKLMPAVTANQDADNPPSTLVASVFDATTSYKHQLHLRAIWDVIDSQGGQLITTPAWDAAFSSYAAALQVPGWGWISRTGDNTAMITNYTANPNETISFTLDAPLFATVQPGKKVPVRVSALNYGKSELNGQLTVQVESTTTCVSVERIVCAPFKQKGQMRFNQPVFRQNALVQDTKIGSRDTGASLFLGRGRAKVRPRF